MGPECAMDGRLQSLCFCSNQKSQMADIKKPPWKEFFVEHLFFNQFCFYSALKSRVVMAPVDYMI